MHIWKSADLQYVFRMANHMLLAKCTKQTHKFWQNQLIVIIFFAIYN